MSDYKAAFTNKAPSIARYLPSSVDIYQPIPNKRSKIGKFNALWDTGSTSTVVTPNVVKECGLVPSGKTDLHGIAGSKKGADTYLVTLILPNKVRVNGVRVAEVPTIASMDKCDVLIGMDIITLGDFSVTNVGKKTLFSFRIPSCKTIDYVEEINAEKRVKHDSKKKIIKAPMRNNRVDGNLPCPCGSGKKWKQCHGKK